jgi:holliday junction DNA helicase RuvA
MISYVAGTIKSIRDQAVTVEVNSIGWALQVSQTLNLQIGNQVSFYVHMHWVQDQGPSLFGFESEFEKSIFLMVISCSGIGPKIGLAVLSDLGPQRFLEIVQAEDEKALSKVSGIGPKKAEQMIVHLKHKVAKLLDSGVQISGSAQITHWQNIQEVLESLNYSRPEITQAIKFVRENEPQVNAPLDHLLRRALSFLSKKI